MSLRTTIPVSLLDELVKHSTLLYREYARNGLLDSAESVLETIKLAKQVPSVSVPTENFKNSGASVFQQIIRHLKDYDTMPRKEWTRRRNILLFSHTLKARRPRTKIPR